MFYVFVLIVAVLGVAIYITVVLRAVPGAMDERLGRLEDLPEDLGVWVQDTSSAEGVAAGKHGLLRETRILLEPGKGLFGRERLVEQIRYREGKGGKIVKLEPERSWTRKRRKV